METSAKNGMNVSLAFEKLIKTIYESKTIDSLAEIKSDKTITKGTKIPQVERKVKLKSADRSGKQRTCC